MPRPSTPYLRIFDKLDIGLEIMEYMSWVTFVAFCNADEAHGQYAQHYVSRRVHLFLGGLVGSREVSNILAMVKKTNGCIIGGVPRCIMADLDQRCVYEVNPPKVMDIVVPRAASSNEELDIHLVDLLTNCHYTLGFSEVADYPHHQTTSRLHVFFNKVGFFRCSVLNLANMVHESQSTRCTINIFVSSTASTLPVLLSQRNTADFCVLSNTHLYNFYLHTTGRRVNIVSKGFSDGQSKTKRYMVGLRSYRTTSQWSEPCGEVCPVRSQQTDRLNGMSVLKWHSMDPSDEKGSGDFDPNGTFGRVKYRWNLGTHCSNTLCPNYGRSVLLSVTHPCDT